MTFLMMLACAGPNGEWAEDLYMGTHTRLTLDANALCAGVSCAWDEVHEIIEVVIADPDVLEAEIAGSSTVDVVATRPGTSKVTIIGLDEEQQVAERYVDITVAPIEQAPLYPRCNVHAPDEEVYILPPETELFVAWNLWGDDYIELEGDPGIRFDDFGVIDLDTEEQIATLVSPAEPGEYVLEADALMRPIASFEVHDGEYDGLDAYALFGEVVEIGDSVWIETALQLDGRNLCIDESPREITVLTPDVCSLHPDTSVTEATIEDPTFHAYAVASGDCVLTVEAEGHSAEINAIVL